MAKSVYTRKYKSLLKAIKQARLDAGLTQIDVANSLNRPQSFVSKCESGERRIDVIELLELCGLYDIEPEHLMRIVQNA